MASAWQDLRKGARQLTRSRGFTAIALITLALGIGANTAIFQLLDAVQLRPLPVYAPSQLAEIHIRNSDGARGNFTIWHADATDPIFQQIRARQDVFSDVFAWSPGGMGYGEGPSRRWLQMMLVSGRYFPVLGLQPALGRLLNENDDTRGCMAPGVVLSYEFWQREFAGDRGVIDRTLRLGGLSFPIVGVAPRHFEGLEIGRKFDIAVPLCAEWLPPGSPNRLDASTEWFLVVMGRLKPGTTLATASARLAAISPAVFEASLRPDYPAENVAQYRAFTLEALDASTGISMLREQYSSALWFLQATAILVLLVGCANLANLMLARWTSRQHELAARVALGAGRTDLIKMLLAETLLLSVAGAALGAWMARGLTMSAVKYIGGDDESLFLNLGLDWRLLAFITLAAMVTCLLCGLAAAWRSGRVSAIDILRSGARGSTDSRDRVGLRQVLVTTQVALSLLLLTGALVFLRSLDNLVSQNLGFQPEGVTIGYVDMSEMNVPPERRPAFTRHVLDTLESTPGVVSASVTSIVPLSGSSSDNEVWLDGAAAPLRATSNFADVSPHYFKTLEVPIVGGRVFDDRDSAGSTPVAVVNEAFVKRFVPDGRPIGKHVWREARANKPAVRYEIVGLVKDAKYRTLREDPPPTMYVPGVQDPDAGTFAQMLIRTSMPPAAIEPTLTAAFRAAGPAIVPTFGNFQTMIDRALTQDKMLAALSGFFGVFAVILATVGLYGSMSYVVARRTREIGIRIALGAQRRSVLRLVLTEALVLVAAGCAIGGALALALSHYVRTLVFALEPAAPLTMFGAVMLLSAVAVCACLVPARRATRVDPAIAFRAE